MELSLEITEAAKLDIIDAVYYYQKISSPLAERFYFDLIDSLEAVNKNPTYFSYYEAPFRKLLLKHFPYLNIFKVYNQVVVITGIVFAKQNPDKTKQRSKE